MARTVNWSTSGNQSERKGETMEISNLIKEKSVVFNFKAEPGKDVFVGGTFNKWNPRETKLEEKEGGVYTASLQLPLGRHEYRFIVDDVWYTDPENPETAPNPFGSMNSLVTVE
jgi:1,4-alpha-glucan branching enzyme